MCSLQLKEICREASLLLYVLDIVVGNQVENPFELKRIDTIDMHLITGIEEVEIRNMCSTQPLKRWQKILNMDNPGFDLMVTRNAIDMA